MWLSGAAQASHKLIGTSGLNRAIGNYCFFNLYPGEKNINLLPPFLLLVTDHEMAMCDTKTKNL